MSHSTLIGYHSDRATRELDLGMAASSPAAARAHLELASLHMARVRELSWGAARQLMTVNAR
jgi:hypothetical protein